MSNVTFKIFHADHGICKTNMDYIKRHIEAAMDESTDVVMRKVLPNGAIRWEVKDLPKQAPCGLYGPAMGDAPVLEAEMRKRSKDRPADRMISAPFRPVNYVNAIGIVDAENNTVVLFTVYGGAFAEQNPADPSLREEDRAAAEKFWSEHALALSEYEELFG